jgi:hypothetical protein
VYLERARIIVMLPALVKPALQITYRYLFSRANTVSRGNNASTASTDGVCV